MKEALAHPTWNMGPKITIDSATLMNKGLEVIEAHYLFGLDYRRSTWSCIPESIVHGIAEFADGSMIAQMAAPTCACRSSWPWGSPTACRRASSGWTWRSWGD